MNRVHFDKHGNLFAITYDNRTPTAFLPGVRAASIRGGIDDYKRVDHDISWPVVLDSHYGKKGWQSKSQIPPDHAEAVLRTIPGFKTNPCPTCGADMIYSPMKGQASAYVCLIPHFQTPQPSTNPNP